MGHPAVSRRALALAVVAAALTTGTANAAAAVTVPDCTGLTARACYGRYHVAAPQAAGFSEAILSGFSPEGHFGMSSPGSSLRTCRDGVICGQSPAPGTTYGDGDSVPLLSFAYGDPDRSHDTAQHYGDAEPAGALPGAAEPPPPPVTVASTPPIDVTGVTAGSATCLAIVLAVAALTLPVQVFRRLAGV